jgi:hypothetical protein
MKTPTNTEIERDAKLLRLLQNEIDAGRSRFKAKSLCEWLNCSFEELLSAFDRLLRAGHMSPVGSPPRKHGRADGPN